MIDVEDIKELTARAAERWGDKIGLIFDEWNIALTYQEMETRSNAIANMLLTIGVEPGDRVAVMLRNRPEFPLTWLALAKIGAAMVPVNVNYKEVDGLYLLEHSETKAIVTSEEFVPLLRKLKPSIESLKIILSVDKSEHSDIYNFHDLCNSSSVAPPTVGVHSETLLNIQFTSGTTGLPKGCMLTHEYWLTIVQKCIELYPKLTKHDILMTAQPFYYIDPQWNLLSAMAAGASLIVLDRFHPSTFWERARHYRVTFFYCLGIMPVLMLKTPPSPRDRENHVRAILCSGIPPQLHRELEERWGAPWYEVFGMTETGGVISIKPEDHQRFLGTGCLGKPDTNLQVRIVNNQGQPVPRGEAGELLLRVLGMMDGYYKEPQATEDVFRAGWFHTGDLVRMDESGYMYYVGRKKEMIRRSGENISASEVEEVIKLHPQVHYAACVPVKDEVRGEEVKAYVVLKAGQSVETVPPQELIEFCTQRLAYFKIPRYWDYRDDLPRTPSERVAKHVLIKEKTDLREHSFDRVEQVWRGKPQIL